MCFFDELAGACVRKHSSQTLELGNQYTDNALFLKIAEGDEQAFALCVHRFTPSLFPYIKSIVKSEFWAEDLLQDLYVQLWKKRDQLATVENPGGYLNRMASNLSINFLKRRSVEVRAQYYLEQGIGDLLHSETGRSREASEHWGVINRAVQQLTSRQQTIYRLRYDEELSYDQIARQLGLSRNTVRNHLVTAMATLRQFLKEQGDILVIVCFLF